MKFVTRLSIVIGLLFSLIYGVYAIPPLPVANQPRIITTDWAIAETLSAMGTPPVGIGDLRAYNQWVVQPAMTATTIDLGLRTQPNLELVKTLRPNWILNASWLPPIPDQFLQSHTQVRTIDFYGAQGISWSHILDNTQKIGQIIGQDTAAAQLINQTQNQLAQQKQQLASFSARPFIVVQFIDTRRLRIYGHNSLFDETLKQLGLHNAWMGETNAWGFSHIDLAELAKLPENSFLVVVQPHPLNVPIQLEKSLIWQRLPFRQTDHHVVLPPVWSFGALPSAQHFAQTLTDALLSQRVTPW